MSAGKLKVLVVEDELPARERLISMLQKFDDFGEIQEATNGEEALAKLPDYKPDVVFLDIQMPGIGGIDLARELMAEDEPPLVIFVTAYDKYAIEAFEVNAIDYLLKPANKERLETTVARIREIMKTNENKGQFIDDLSVALNKLLQKSDEEKVARLTLYHEESGNRIVVEPQEIWWIFAKGDKTYARTEKAEYRIFETLSNLTKRLSPDLFIRSHKAYIVNIKQIQEVIPWFSGTYNLKMKDGETELPLSRSFVAQFKEKVGWT